MSDGQQIQGSFLSFAEISIHAEPDIGQSIHTRDYKSIEWDDSLVPEKVRGAGPYALGRTIGQHDANASVTMYQAKALLLIQRLGAGRPDITNGLAAMIATFNMPIFWTPIDDPDNRIYQVALVGCRLTKRAMKNAQGPAANEIELPLSVMRIDWYDAFGDLIP